MLNIYYTFNSIYNNIGTFSLREIIKVINKCEYLCVNFNYY